MNILNLKNGLDVFDDEEETCVSNGPKVHIRIQARNGRKSITSVSGLATDLDLKKILKSFKKTLKCNGAILDDEELGKIIQLQGDHRVMIRDFLVEQEINVPDDIIMHGF